MILFLIDDERDMQALFQQRYRKEIKAGEIKLVFSDEGKKALAKLDQIEKDQIVIIADLQLPDISGISLMKQIREKYQLEKIYIVSGSADSETKEECIRQGASGFIMKPIDFDLIDRLLK